MRRIALLPLMTWAACNNNVVNTPLRSFDRPSDVALFCVQPTVKPGTCNLQSYQVRPLTECTPEAKARISVEHQAVNKSCPSPTELRALVANSARGELALVNLELESIVDTNLKVPGFNFLPVGALPEHVRVTEDGCAAVTTNTDSCDLSLVDISTLSNLSLENLGIDAGTGNVADVVHRVVIRAGGKTLGARPTWVELAPDSQLSDTANNMGMCEGHYRAWVALPGCGLVAEVDLSGTPDPATGTITADVTQAIQVGLGTASVVTDLSTISCPNECSGAGTSFAVDAATAAPGDGGTASLPTTQAFPGVLAIDREAGQGAEGERLFVGDQFGERIYISSLDATGVAGAPRALALETGARGVLGLRVSPRSQAGKFLYAIARDATVRVVDLDREVECETNPDPRAFQAEPPADPFPDAPHLGCFPLGDPATPRRAGTATSPGITLPGGALPRDVAFVHLDLPPPPVQNDTPPSAGPSLLVGDFAWIVGSDGHGTAVNIFDACPQPNVPQSISGGGFTPACDFMMSAVINSSRSDAAQNPGSPTPLVLDRLSHRLRAGEARFFTPPSPADLTGAPRFQDEAFPTTVTFGTQKVVETTPDGGVETDMGGAGPDMAPEDMESPKDGGRRLDGGADPHLTPPPVVPDMGAAKAAIVFPDPEIVRNETWNLQWEGLLPGSARAVGNVCKGNDASCPAGALVDPGAAPCSHGAVAGDKLVLTGCRKDHNEDCGFGSVCAFDPGAPPSVDHGLCLPKSDLNAKIAACGPLLRAVRRYRVLSARQGTALPGETTDLFQLGEIYEPEYSFETRTCTADAECKMINSSFSCLPDADGAKRCLLSCSTTNPSNVNGGCGTDFECAISRFGDTRCMRSPLDPGLFATCLGALQPYEVHAGDSFLVSGSVSGTFSDLEPDPDPNPARHGECRKPPVSSEFVRLRQSRIPISPTALMTCPPAMASAAALLPAETDTNVCLFQPATAPGTEEQVHFENLIFSIGLALPKGPDTFRPPDGFVLSFILVGGGFPLQPNLIADIQAQQPRVAVVGPDLQTIYVVDEGKQSTPTGLRGQLLRLVSSVQTVDTNFKVR